MSADKTIQLYFLNLSHLRKKFPANSLQSRVAKGAFWNFGGSLLAQAIGMLTSIITARLLGKVGFGELGIIRSTILMFGSLAGSGIGLAATKYIAEYRTTDKIRLSRILGILNATTIILGLLASMFCFFFSDFLAKEIFKSPDLSALLEYSSPLLFLGSYSSFQLGAISGFEKFKKLSLLIIIDSVLLIIFIGLGCFYFGVSGAIIGTVISTVLGIIVKRYFLIKEYKAQVVKITYKDYKSEILILVKFVLPTMLLGIALQPFEWISRVLLSRQNDGFAELGVFTVVFTWAQLVMYLPGQVTGTLTPIFSNLLANNETQKIKKLMSKSLLLVVIFSLLTSLPLFAISSYVLRFYGNDFTSGKKAFYIMLLTYVVSSITLVFRCLFISLNKSWLQFLHTIILGLILALVSYFLISNGSVGLSLAYLISYSIFTIIQFFSAFLMLRRF